jgi:hypothetical protein
MKSGPRTSSALQRSISQMVALTVKKDASLEESFTHPSVRTDLDMTRYSNQQDWASQALK